MARRSGSRGLGAANEQIRSALQPFIIPNVRQTGRVLGEGSYGSVEELDMDGARCAGKKLYDLLVDPENQGAQRMVERYYAECQLLSDLRHPHIVQFLGVCFIPDIQLPVLVTELLADSLDDLLEKTPNIPLFTKLSLLQDVCRGLVHLHGHRPVIIHRDLTARNVLLTSDMKAKIADLGNSRIVNIQPGQLAQTMTKSIPGTLVYMPPEGTSSTGKYGPSLDMFSFGHLALFTATQIFPGHLLSPTYFDLQTNSVKARTELERRSEYIDTLHTQYSEKKFDSLIQLIKTCLHNNESKRLTARRALEIIGGIKAGVRDLYGTLTRLELEKQLQLKVRV